MQRKKVIGSQFPLEFVKQNLDTFIIMLKKGFTNNEIAVKFLQHFIRNLDARPYLDQKLLLINNYRSHKTPKFIKLANKNYILLYPLFAYITYYIQPLNISVFQLYKHQYNIVIKNAIASLDIKYSLRSFLRDLAQV